MTLDLDALPDDVDALHRLIRELAALQNGDRAELAQAQTEIQRLRFIVQRLQRSQFGRRSERVDGISWPSGSKTSRPISLASKRASR